MVNTIYQKSFAALMKRPFRLWGISLLGALLCWLAGIGFAGILAVGFAIAWAIDVSLAMIFLHTYQTGEEPHTADLFQTFRKDRFLRVVGGMAWMSLWIFLWSLIPVVGIVFGVIREETGLTIENPKLCGIKEFQKEQDGKGFIVFLYVACRFSGELRSSAEGEVFWYPLSELKRSKELADGFSEILPVFKSEEISEVFYTKNWDTVFC